MRETSFIEQNKEKWKEFEKVLDRQYKDPDKLNDLFVQITDDLSYSRTFYPNRSVRVYLNSLAQRIFFSIYKNRKSKGKRFLSFWTDELPQLMYEARGDLFLAFLLFLVACSIGVLSSMMDPEFAQVVLGEGYVNMTLENIESGDPMAVYKARGELGMSLFITGNNIRVALLTFVLGVFFRVGTMAILFSNGIMLGCFQYFFIEKDLFQESFLTIWIHGTLEISAIVIAGAAGLTMGRGLIFPGTYTRIQAFQRSARRGVKIMIGTIPLFIVAGFLEGYLTRHTETPDIIRAFFILACLAFVLAYFVFYPQLKAQSGFKTKTEDAKILPDVLREVNFNRIKPTGELLADLFLLLKKLGGPILLLSFASAALYCVPVFLLPGQAPSALYDWSSGIISSYGLTQIFMSISEISLLFSNEAVGMGVLMATNLLLFLGLTVMTTQLLLKVTTPNKEGRFLSFSFILTSLLSLGSLLTILWLDFPVAFVLVLLIIAFPLLWIYTTFYEQNNPGLALRRTFFLSVRNLNRIFGLFIILWLIGLSLYALTDTFLAGFFLELISWVVYLEQETMDEFSVVLFTFIKIFVVHLVYIVYLIGTCLLYHCLVEIKEAKSLRERIQSIGMIKSIRGIETEA